MGELTSLPVCRAIVLSAGDGQRLRTPFFALRVGHLLKQDLRNVDRPIIILIRHLQGAGQAGPVIPRDDTGSPQRSCYGVNAVGHDHMERSAT
jgi:hypothetical protein